jgi:hypothetical protein
MRQLWADTAKSLGVSSHSSYKPDMVFLKSMWVGVAPRSSSEHENLCVTSFLCRLGDESSQNEVNRRFGSVRQATAARFTMNL